MRPGFSMDSLFENVSTRTAAAEVAPSEDGVSTHVAKSSEAKEGVSPGGVRTEVLPSTEVLLSSSGGVRWSFDIALARPGRGCLERVKAAPAVTRFATVYIATRSPAATIREA